VAPVDAGVIAAELDLSDPRGADGTAADDLVLAGETVGAAIRMRREARGMTLDELSLATRIKPQYLAALEAMRLAELPSRAFVVGYIRACASALGLDPEQAAERFRREEPDGMQALAAPGGVDRETDPRVRTLVTLGAVVVLAIVAWNIAERVVRHSPTHQGARVAPAARLPVSSRSPVGPVSLGAPLPPPIESTAPEPYVTPGLPSASSAPAQSAAPAAPPIGAPFEARAAVYGLAPGAAHIIFVAAKPVSFVVHGADGSVYFARQLETGEAYAAPQLAGLSIEVSNPAVVNVYIDRAFKGVLPGPTTPLSSLAPAAPASTPAPAPAAQP
jgi:cytoskeleton protein RodZ